MDDLLLAVNDDKSLAAEWMMNYLGKRYEDKFTEVAVYCCPLRLWMQRVLAQCGKKQIVHINHNAS
jgi:hypothetical protein